MKKIMFFAITAIAFASCNSNSEKKVETTEKQTAAATTDGVSYTVDSTSNVVWTGTKPTGSHTGNFTVSDGSFTVKDNVLTAGNFTINVASLVDTDLTEADGKSKIEGHLKSPDFFDVAKYPTAKFEITAVENNTDSSKKDITHIIKGNLTLKDSTKNVAIPARITVDAKTIAATADFSIDRTLWGINYKGPNNPQDWVISKSVGLKLDIKATAK